MKTRNINTLICVCLSVASTACSTVPKVVAESPASAVLAPMEKPEHIAIRVNQIDKLSGEKRFYEQSALNTNDEYTGVASDGCTWVSLSDLVAPATSWSSCGSDSRWSSGENKNMIKIGELWPLEVGKKATYTFTQHDSNGTANGQRTRKCEVMSTVNIDVESGNHDAYKVVCTRGDSNWRQTVFHYFSPALNSSVKYVRHTTSNGIQADHELIDIEAL